MPDALNKLYYGDNLKVLRDSIADQSVDLIYLDPPFNSRQDYNVLFAEKDGNRSAAQITAFKDSWEWNEEAALAYEQVVESGHTAVANAMRAFRTLLGGSDMLAYLAMMAPRLIELRRVLKESGSIYLHCDPTASHYLKLLMDGVFGAQFLLNEIIWKRTSGHSKSQRWGPVHDTILYYSKSDQYLWNSVSQAYEDIHIASKYTNRDEIGSYALSDLTGAGTRSGDSGLQWKGIDPTAKGRHWAVPRLDAVKALESWSRMTTQQKLDDLDLRGLIYWPRSSSRNEGLPRFKRYLTDGMPVQDVITDIPPINSQAQERLGYPTQKPEALLERILRASSNEGDVVLDPFCGCGTTVQVAQKLNRRWTGIDITHLAIGLINKRLSDTFGEDIRETYQVLGTPTDMGGAIRLAAENKTQFQYWALDQCGAAPTEGYVKKGADRGIDGRKFFHDDRSGKSKQIIFSVKGGQNVGVAEIRDLGHVVSREQAEIGVYISLVEPTQPMLKEAAEAGFYNSPAGGSYPRLQILSVGDLLLRHKAVFYPKLLDATFKKAPRFRVQPEQNLSFELKLDVE